MTRLATLIFDHAHPINFSLAFNLHEFVLACKKSINSWDTVNFRAQRPDLLNLLWRNSSFRNYAIWLAESILAYISGTRFFPNIGFVQEHSKFIIEQIQWKLMTKFFFKFKKPIFGPFPQFLGQKTFFKKNWVVMHNFIIVLAPWQNPEKSNEPIPRKQPGRCQDARIGRSYFMGSFQLPPEVLQVKL